jgi:site-specific DNA recombinase
MKLATLYARLSSKDQEPEGYSIPAQLKMLRENAQRNKLQIVREFIDIEIAKTASRKQLGEMLQFLIKNSSCRTLIVEKSDRLYRSFWDCVTLEELDVEIHLPKEGQRGFQILGEAHSRNAGRDSAKLH